jgi:hypothetical protein
VFETEGYKWEPKMRGHRGGLKITPSFLLVFFCCFSCLRRRGWQCAITFLCGGVAKKKDNDNVPLFSFVVLLEQRRRWQQVIITFFFVFKKKKKKRTTWQRAIIFSYGGVPTKKAMVTYCHGLLLWWC